ncbi:MAG TPA: hypothetical protein VNU66_01890 [Mycobacteriales bacterium]|nr:hypothetical protein [Mycobacteriales bacterium]
MTAAEALVLEDDAAPATGTAPAAWVPPEPPPAPRRAQLPPRPAVPPAPSTPAAWATALRVRALPTALLGAAVGGLAVAREPGARPAVLAVALVALVAAHGAAALVRCLGDARPRRAGPLRRAEAGRAVLALTGLLAALTAALGVLRGPVALLLAAAGAVAALLLVSRRSGPGLVALGAALGGGGAALLAAWAATGALAWAPALAAGALVAGLLAPRREAVPGGLARALALAPYAAVGLAVGLTALPWPALAVALALPAARRAAGVRADAGPVVAGHARLASLLLVGGLLAAALTGTA